MAEFRLGRIKFVWRNEWAPTTQYVVDDVVNNGGKSYICVGNHTSSALFVTDNEPPKKWDLVSDGLSWQGAWTTSTYYNEGDQVKYGGVVYVCLESHTSASTSSAGLEVDDEKWDAFAESLLWRGAWATSTRYRRQDFVSYGGITYVCNTHHTSAATALLGLEDDIENWTVFNSGFMYLGDWAGTTRYKLNDIVKYGASTWICIDDHTSTTSFETAKWSIFVEGLEFESSWDNAAVYQIGDVITYGGYSYIAKRNNTASNPSTGVNALLDWSVYTTGFNFNGDWDIATAYKVGDVVRLGAYTYLAIADSTGETPPDLAFWNRLNFGFKWTNVSQTYTGVTGTTNGIGSAATFTVVRSKTAYVVTITAGGTNYAVNDVITIAGSSVGGLSPVNNLVLTVTGVTSGSIDTVTVEGYSVTWTSGNGYVQGDIVFFGANSYVCVLEHTADSGKRPDADTGAIYWNLFAAGSESAILTTPGDTYYYSLNGPARLPIGTDGQLLRVTNGYPTWAYYGVINNVVYVAPIGVDNTTVGQGLTVDKPWRTIRFACEQIEKGYRNVQAGELLERNKQFMMKEVSNWVTYTYSVAISAANASSQFVCTSTANLTENMPIEFDGTVGGVVAGTKYFVKTIVSATAFTISATQGGLLFNLSAQTAAMTGSLSYDYDLCQRDVGLLVDALKFDITHGGNEGATTAAKAYYTKSGYAYINSNFGQQIVQTVAAYDFLKDLVADVMNNTAVSTGYQVENGVAVGTIANQVIDTSLVAETNTIIDAVALLTIVTDGISAGTASAIPAAVFANSTISVKTGTFYEVLPIVLPKHTAVVGDELRSTVVSPKPAIANLATDNEKSISALNRIKSVIPNLVANVSISPTVGNTAQQYLVTETGIETSVTDNVNTMVEIIGSGLTVVPAFELPTPTGGTGNAFTAGYFNAARLVFANKAFLQAEVSAWIDAQILAGTSPFNGFVYAGVGRTKCERDVGYIVDALRFDLTYGGNLATVIAARSYYSNGVLVEVGEEEQAKAVQLRIKDIIDNIVTGNTAGWTKTPANALTQNVSGTAGSAPAATFAQARIQEIHDTLDTGTSPTTIAPDITWPATAKTTANTAIQAAKTRIQASAIEWVNAVFPTLVYNATTCSRDVGYIVDALSYDLMFGSNFLSVWNAMSYYRGLTSTGVVIDTQLTPTIGIIGFAGASVKELVTGQTGVVGDLGSAKWIEMGADTIYDILNNGLSGVPTEIITDPTGFDTGYLNARTQIANNYAFIKADVSQYIQNNYPAVWTALGATGQAACQRDVGYILDAVRYDITYGGNTQSLIAGSAYYSSINLTIAASELTATIAAYGHLKSIIDDVARKLTVTPQAGNSTPQVVSGTGGSVGAATASQDRVQDVIDWITNGLANATIAPTTGWVPPASLEGFNLLQARKEEIKLDALGYVQKFFQSLAYNEDTCARDVGYMVDALGYDMMFGSNAASITVGRSYHRAIASTAIVLANQKDASLGLVKFLKYKLKGYAVAGAVGKMTTVIDDIIGTIDGGAVPRLLWPSFTGVDAENFAGAKLVWENTAFVQAETLQFIYNNYPAIEYNKGECARDVGYIIDALRYDLTYGGSYASKQAGVAYYSRLTSALQIDSGDKTATLAAYANMKAMVQAIASGGSYSALQNKVSRLTGTTGDAGTSTRIGQLVDIITNIVDLGLTNGVPKITITAIASGTTFTSGTHGLAVGDEIMAQSTANGLTIGTTYYVLSTPLPTTFTLSATYDGSVITTFTSGTGLSIGAEITNLPSVSWANGELVTQAKALSTAKASIQTSVTNFIGNKYPNLVYNSATCARDVGYILDAIRYDMMLGSNFRAIKAGMSYYQAQASKVLGDQKRATLNAYRFLADTVKDAVASSAAASAVAKKSMSTIINILDLGVGETPDVVGSVSYLNNLGMINSADLIGENKSFLENEATAWISYTFGGPVSATSSMTSAITTTRSHNLSVGDPVKFTTTIVSTTATNTTASTNIITVLDTTGMVVGSKIVFTGASLGGISSGVTYFIKSINSSTEITISGTYNGTVVTLTTASGTALAVAGGVIGGLEANVQYYVLATPTPTTFTIATTPTGTTAKTLSTDSGTCTAIYAFDEVSCKRDMGTYIDAIIEDVKFPGNYKGTRAAILYNNAVKGSELADMFLVSNGSGLRNMTFTGLTGDLTETNDFGTRRPTAGAFVALNPGFGPYDSRVWVSQRSHYSQNITMFGSGATGAKIDAALHAGGNKSMVKNDFTTIMSDGIGVWVTGEGSLTELVSVFNYFGYAGYLAELGGRIRATNGNSSYGTYGVIAEGVDVHETPLYGTVDNRYNQAYITNVVTDALNEVLRLEFNNAGSNYTNTTYTISGSGYNADAIGDEFRDGAVFETRIIDLNDDNGFGGTGYVSAANAAQNGDLVSITIAATDTALSAAYVGMRIQLTAGTGVGQYANILTYGTGSKIAQVYKDSFTSLTSTATTVTTNLITVASTVSLFDNMALYFTGTTFGGITANTAYYVIGSTITATQFKVAAVSGSTTPVTLSTASGSMTILAAGWDHTVAGRAIETTLDLTTQYNIEPRVSYTVPGYTSTARTLNTSAAWRELTFGDNKYVAIAGSGSASNFSANGTTWANAGALATSASWIDVVYGGGEGAVATAVVGGLGGQGAVLTAVLGVANTTGSATQDQIASVTVVNGGQGYSTPPVIVFTPVSGGTGAVATCAVLNGAIVSVTVTVPGTSYSVAPTVSAVTDRVTEVIVNSWGKNYTSNPVLTIADPFTGTAWTSAGTATTNDIISHVNSGTKNWYRATSTGTFTTSGPIHTSGSTANGSVTLLYIGTTTELSATRTNNGVSSITVTKSGAGYSTTPALTILDSGARYVAIATGSGDNCYTTRAGIAATSAWTAGTGTGKTDLTALAYGNGVYVAVGGTNSAVSSTTGSLWTGRTIPTLGAGTYSSVAYGNGTFVAIATGSLETATSANGNSWTAAGNMPSSSTWTSIAYGNGRFVAIASGTRNAAYSLDKGATWSLSQSQLPASATWTRISYGAGLFFAVASGGTTAATSPDGINWTLRAMPSSSNWSTVHYGSINGNPLWVGASSTTGTVAASIKTGAQTTGRVRVASGIVTEVRLLEPGSGYPAGTVSATTTSTNLITVDNTTNLVDSQPIEFYGTSAGGLLEEITYYVIGSTITSTQFKVSATAGSATAVSLSTETPVGMTYRAGPVAVVTDPNKVKTVALRVRTGNGALGNPSFTNRGADNATATAETQGDGYSDLFQPSSFINVAGLYDIPLAGANVEFDSLPGVYFKLVVVTNELGNLGNKTATFQINPALSVLQAPRHGDRITTRLKYSQVRLTGHDFLYIGTGNKEQTNYPNVDISTAITANQASFSAGGRVFFTSTDQDGNFNVGNLFGVQQATGTATLNASAFNLSGLNSLQLGAVELGVGSAIITQFSTDPFFTADSDNVVPTQRAIKAYITAQIGGGQSSLNVNTLTSGVVYIAGNSISTTTGEGIRVTSKMNFTGGIDGAPVALGFFMQK